MRSINIYWFIAAACISGALCVNIFAQLTDPTQIVAKHRDSIGAESSLASVRNQLILSEARFTYGGNTNFIVGKFLLLSTSEKNLFGMNFTSNDYPQDRFGFDGKSVKVRRSTPTTRSLIGDFLNNNPAILRSGLLGGTLSAGWPLLDLKLHGGKVKFQGTKTISGKEFLVLSYEPKGASDLTIKLFFEPGTFRHTRSEYTLVTAAAQGHTIDSSAGQSGTTFRLIEEFSNFAKMGGLTMPSSYKITYSRSSAAGTVTAGGGNRDAEWTFKVTDFGINRELDADAFDITDK
jgi:hypothetical protein